MNLLIAESVALLAVTFLVFALIGSALAGPKKKRATRAPVFDMPPAVEPEVRRPEPVRYLDAAAEHFTAGVTAPQPAPQPVAGPTTMDLDRPAYVPFAPTQFETVTVPVPAEAMAPTRQVVIDDYKPLRKEEPVVSSLAVMTPESVEAAVQQAGSGLEPLRLGAPQGTPDDLTVISGITDDQQKQLNAYGVYHFWQIAGWSPENVAWVSQRVLSPHRIARENWMAQAARLSGLKG